MNSAESDLRLFRECFDRNGSGRTNEQLQWQYVMNPTGKLFVDLAVNADRIAAIYASLPVRVWVDGEVRLGLQSLDTLTDAEFRGKGLFVQLARTLFERAGRSDVAFIYGFPNGNSAHGFFKRLEWTPLDPVPFIIRPLRVPYVVARLKIAERLRAPWLRRLIPNIPLQLFGAPVPPSCREEAIDRFDERVDDLWKAFARTTHVAIHRDARYLNWRLVDKPGESYERRALVRDERFEALVSWCVKGKHGGRVGYVMELLHRPGARWAAWILLQRALREMAIAGADVALAWCFEHSHNYRVHQLSGFVPFPEKLRPIELHAGARAFDEKLRPLLADRHGWYLSYLDSDTV